MIVTGLKNAGSTHEFIVSSLLPAIGLSLFVLICFIILLKQEKHAKNEIEEIREKGDRISGRILSIETHEHTIINNDGPNRIAYTYTFVVEYEDRLSGETVVAESLSTDNLYKLRSEECIIRVLDGKVLVEKAYASAYSTKWPKKDIFILTGVLLVFVLLVLYVVLPIIKTLP